MSEQVDVIPQEVAEIPEQIPEKKVIEYKPVKTEVKEKDNSNLIIGAIGVGLIGWFLFGRKTIN